MRLDAVVVGAGHNGLVAANVMADAGWDVVVCEATAHVGGAVRSDRSVHPDFVTDLYSAFYPLGFASPALRALDLERHGLVWSHAPSVLAHIFPDDRVAVLSRDAERTAASVDAFAAGDGAAWLDLVAEFDRIREPFLQAALGPFPPVRAGLSVLRRLGAADALRFARFAVTPVRQFSAERFRGAGAAMLLAGNASHGDQPPENAGTALYGWLLALAGQVYGFPVPVGGSSGLIEALTRRLGNRGQIRRGAPVESILVERGQAGGVRLAGGEVIRSRTVLADVSAPALYGRLVDPSHLPPRLLADLRGFAWDLPTLKLNWALSAPIPWLADGARGAGTIHLDSSLDDLTRYSAALTVGELPQRPFVLFGQMTTSDATRSPAGTESAWAYTHLPRDSSPEDVRRQTDRVQALIERHAPGFGALTLGRSVQSPHDLEQSNANLVQGAVGGGTQGVHQLALFRPLPGLGRAETPIEGLYLASASAHPGGGVHGTPGANAAHAALLGRWRHRVAMSLLRRVT